MAEPARPLVSEADFKALPESTDKMELLDGEVVMSPSPSYWHQEILQRLVVTLRAWADSRAESILVGQAPLDVRFAEGRILQPDAFVAFATVDRNHEGPLALVPELCVEVLSTNRVYDRVTKRLVYAAAGVTEYWVVEPTGLIERWSGDGLMQVSEHAETLESPILPGYALDLHRLFR